MLFDDEKIRNFIEETPGYATTEKVYPVLREYIDEEDREIFTPGKCGFEANYNNSRAALYANCNETLSYDLVRFRNFPGALQKFGCRFYRLPGQTWISNMNRHYCYKQELFSILVYQLEFPEKKDTVYIVVETNKEEDYNRHPKAEYLIKVIYRLCDMYLEYKERTLLNGICEFTEIEWKKINDFREELRTIFRKESSYNAEKFTIDVFKTAIERKFNSVCPELDVSELRLLLTTIENKLDFKARFREYLFIARVVLVFITKCEKFIEENKSWFTISNDGGQQPFIVRMLKSGNDYFFLASELLEYLRRRNENGGEFMKELEDMTAIDQVATIGRDQVKHGWKHKVKNAKIKKVEYIKYTARKTYRRAIYISYDKTKYCILAYHAFIELLRWLISTKKLFWKKKLINWRVLIGRIIERFPKFDETETIQLMSLEEVQEVRQFANNQFSALYKESEPQGADENALEDFFVRIESKNSNPTLFEIQLLGRNPCMSEILDIKKSIVDMIRMTQELVKPEKKLPLFFCYHATEYAQLAYILRKMYCRYEWIVNQGFSFNRHITALIENVRPQGGVN